MHDYYGDKRFFRVVEEAVFWKQQEAEHTVVIRQAVPGLEEIYVNQLQNWQQAFAQTQAAAVKYMEAIIRSGSHISPKLQEEIMQFIRCCINQSCEFVNFLNIMAANSPAIRENPFAISLIDHIRRESEYFIGIAMAAIQREQHK